MKRYDVEINGVPTTLLLSEEDAKARGLEKAEVKKAAPAKAAPAKKARTVPNKARTPAAKRTEVAEKAWQRKK